MKKNVGQHLDMLDGFRGMLAFWVFGGHLMGKCHAYLILFAEAGSAVDLFMYVSGFLMAWHWLDREASFSRVSDQSVDFYIRRFFRIAPLYYPLLIVACVMQPDWNSSLTWPSILLHVSFLFGIFPQYASNNLLPDWSISLEMQFYLLFPLLMLALRYAGAIICLFVGVQAMQIMHGLFGLYLKAGPLGTFPYPSCILFRLHIFLAGMLLAKLLVSQVYGEKEERPKLLFYYLALIVYAFLFSPSAVSRWALFLTVVLVVDAKYLGMIVKVFSCSLARFMGDVSYSVYLVHLLVLQAALPFLVAHVLPGKSPRADFAISALILIPTVYAISYFLHRTIEAPGIEFGRKLAKRWKEYLAGRRPLAPGVFVAE